VTNDGAINDLDQWRTELNGCEVALFSNNYTPVRTSVPGDFTESAFVGYSRVLSPNFAAAFLNPDGKAQINSDILTWTFTSGSGTAVVWGWYILDAGDAHVLVAGRFLLPITLAPASPNLSRVLALTAVTELG